MIKYHYVVSINSTFDHRHCCYEAQFFDSISYSQSRPVEKSCRQDLNDVGSLTTLVNEVSVGSSQRLDTNDEFSGFSSLSTLPTILGFLTTSLSATTTLAFLLHVIWTHLFFQAPKSHFCSMLATFSKVLWN